VNEDRPWLGEEPTGRPDNSFPPGPTGFGVFLAVAGPIVFIGIAYPDGTNLLIIGAGLVVGLIAGLGAASWLESRDGQGPQPPI
jgi:hypothetical protein